MSSQDTFKIFCGNLSPATTDNDLHDVFAKHGTVVEAVVMTGKNFGFVHMASEAQGMKALQRLENYILHGQKMVVQRAISSKRAAFGKRNIVGEGIRNLDDFDCAFDISDGTFNYHHGQDIPYLLHNSNSSSTSAFSTSINQISSSNLSDDNSSRLSPLVISSASSSYTPEHGYQMKIQQDGLENATTQEEKAVCAICREKYDNSIHVPKILSCNHTFCLECLRSITQGREIKCPIGCPYITTLQESGVAGLTTNQTKIIINNNLPAYLQVQEPPKDQSYENEICCVCLCTPPNRLCCFHKHEIIRDSEAFITLRPRLKNLIDMSLTMLRNVMAMQASLKERMQYTLHSLTKFSEELKSKIDGEDFQQDLQQRHLANLHEYNVSLINTTSVSDLLQMCNKVESFSQTIVSQYNLCFAKDAINGALDSILLRLKEPLMEPYLSQLGFKKEEAFSLTSSLREHVDKGNFANVLLIYLLCDLLSTRCRPTVIGPPPNLIPEAHSFGNTAQSPSLNSFSEADDSKAISNSSEIFDLNKMIETTNAIESSVPISMNGVDNGSDERYGSPMVSSALSLGISNISLIGRDKSANGVAETLDEEGGPRPVSYLDAVKKPAKQSGGSAGEGQVKLLPKTVPSPIKPSKFPHCWMIVSINGVNVGRILFQLRPDKAPKMCDNFIGLCTGRSGYGYKGTHFFKSGDGFLVGGDVENDDGTGGFSVYEKQKFEADLCPLKDDVGMVRFKGVGTSDNGRGMVGSQFMIWFTEREFKKFSFSLVFGRVVDGLNIVQEAANHNLNKVAIKVEDCGAAL